MTIPMRPSRNPSTNPSPPLRFLAWLIAQLMPPQSAASRIIPNQDIASPSPYELLAGWSADREASASRHAGQVSSPSNTSPPQRMQVHCRSATAPLAAAMSFATSSIDFFMVVALYLVLVWDGQQCCRAKDAIRLEPRGGRASPSAATLEDAPM
jgi:hypothetical protein